MGDPALNITRMFVVMKSNRQEESNKHATLTVCLETTRAVKDPLKSFWNKTQTNAGSKIRTLQSQKTHLSTGATGRVFMAELQVRQT